MSRTRIKICGLTRAEDIQAVVAAGADAIGFVFYPKSPRYVTPRQAASLIAAMPPYVTTVGLFVNASVEEVLATRAVAPLSLLQFHGDETPEHSAALAGAVNTPFTQVFRVKPDTSFEDLLETYVDAYGGAGKVFDWSLIPEELAPRVVLSGGLSVQNATDAVVRVRPYAVDISSGVEASKGIKDASRVRAFIAAVQAADAIIARGNHHE